MQMLGTQPHLLEELEINQSGFEPLGQAVIVSVEEMELPGGIVLPDSVRQRQMTIETKAMVIAVGPEAWRDEKAPRAKPGDRVMISKYSGVEALGPRDSKPYRIVNANDIFVAIK